MQGEKRYLEATLQAGGSADADRLSGYHLGGTLPFSGEFPLELPGYYNGELAAKRYAVFGAAYGVPVVAQDLVWSRLFFNAANVTFLPGEGQPGPWNTGAAEATRSRCSPSSTCARWKSRPATSRGASSPGGPRTCSGWESCSASAAQLIKGMPNALQILRAAKSSISGCRVIGTSF